MQDSKQLIKKRIVSLLVFLLLVCTLCFGIGKLLEPVTFASYYNHDVEKILNNNEEVELLMVGDSKLYSSMNARILEEKLGYKNVLLASSSSQTIDGSYYLIKDSIEKFHPKKIMLSVDYGTLIEEAKAQGNLLVIDRLSLKNKVSMFRNCFFGHDLLYVFDIYRYRDNLDVVFDMIKDRQRLIDSNYTDDHNSDIYYDYKGYVHRDGSIKTGNMPMYTKGKFSEELFDSYHVKFLNKCIEICKENNIELELIDFPTTMMRMYYVENHGDAIEYFKKLAEENGLKYHSLNMLKGREDFLPDEMMLDYNHTNADGARIVTEIFADIILKENNGEDVSDYFYKDFNEFDRDVDRVVSVDGEISKNDDSLHCYLRSLHPEHISPIYKIEYLDLNNNYKVLVDWTKESEFDVKIPQDFNGKVKVIAAKQENDDKYAYQEYGIN